MLRICLTFPFLSLVVVAFAASAAESKQPNVLFILADDLGIGDLRCYGNDLIDTPHIDALADGGIRFTDHYAPSPLCAPSRAAFLTGRFNHRTGAVDVPSNRGLDRISLSELTFGDHFRRAGYATALIGKWHNGLYCRDYLPHHRGFDSFIGFANGGQDYWKWNLLHNDEAFPHDGRYLSDVLNDETIRFIQACGDNDKPFAVVLAHHAPHPPFQAPAPLVEKYRRRLGDEVSRHVAVIYAMIESMDAGLGRVFASLKSKGLWKDTVIVFTSDNGAYLGNSAGGSTVRYHGGYSGNKGDVGEQGIRVPAIASWANHFPAGQVSTVPVHGCDWLPTFLGLTGQRAPKGKPIDGVDLTALLIEGDPTELVDRALPFQKNRYRPARHSDAAVRSGPWKLVWPGVSVTMKKDSARDNPSYLRGIEHPHWEMPLDRQLDELPEFAEPKPRLYRLDQDAAEQRDLANQHPELVRQMTDRYNDWYDEVILDWRVSREAIVTHDEQYWLDRQPPDPELLFQDYWIWNRAPEGVDPKTADPTTVFRGFWNANLPE